MPEKDKKIINEDPANDMINGDDNAESRAKLDKYIEVVLFFILGILIGIALKTEANKRITIGYNDYQIPISREIYSINKLQFDLMEKYEQEAEDLQSPDAAAENPDSLPEQSNPEMAN